MANPNTLDWIHYQDIQINDVNIATQFQQYFLRGQYVESLSLLTNNSTQLQGKAYIAQTLNVICSNLLNLEEKFNNNVPVFLNNLLTQYTTLINNFINRQEWNSTTQYQPYNFVIYNEDIYMCYSVPPVGTFPSDNNYWIFLGLKGKQGPPGINVNMKYGWNSSTFYQTNDLVVYDYNIYVALKNNNNVVPGTDSTTWLEFLLSSPGEIYVGITEPSNLVNNAIWFKTEEDISSQTTNTTLIGGFYCYNINNLEWVPMYPNTLFHLIQGIDNYSPVAQYFNFVILTNQWNNKEYSYTNYSINSNSYINVFPGNFLNENQYILYNNLNMEINNNTIVFSSNINPTVDLPIIIKIQ